MADTQPAGVAGSTSLDLTDIVERLAAHRTVGAAPRAELEWLAAHGYLRAFAVGETIGSTTEPVHEMFVVLSGRISIYFNRGGSRHKYGEWRAGDVTGLLPYSRLVFAPGDSFVDEPGYALVIRRENLPEMIRDCQELTTILVHVMLDRARVFTSSMLHDEKLKSLGKLAAGLAHELNNPAAAIRRSAKLLPQGVEAMESAARELGSARLTPEELAAVTGMRDGCLRTIAEFVRSPLEEAEREEALTDWLESHGVEENPAEALAQSPISVEALERLAAGVRRDVLALALRWVAADCSVRSLAGEIEHAGVRISDLVTAVRGFTQVDAAQVPEAVNVAEGLAQTLAVLRGKARGKAIRAFVTVEDDLPPVRGVPAELNQVWANLIDNALDAAPPSGSVEVTAGRRGSSVVVRVIDDGAGIPADVRDHIFDPFFTTKDVGKGTGLGLDIVRRLVARHNGDIEVDSRPGRTEFAVTLPIHEGGGQVGGGGR